MQGVSFFNPSSQKSPACDISYSCTDNTDKQMLSHIVTGDFWSHIVTGDETGCPVRHLEQNDSLKQCKLEHELEEGQCSAAGLKMDSLALVTLPCELCLRPQSAPRSLYCPPHNT